VSDFVFLVQDVRFYMF